MKRWSLSKMIAYGLSDKRSNFSPAVLKNTLEIKKWAVVIEKNNPPSVRFVPEIKRQNKKGEWVCEHHSPNEIEPRNLRVGTHLQVIVAYYFVVWTAYFEKIKAVIFQCNECEKWNRWFRRETARAHY